ncbi:MAG: hypothetical protein JW828_06700 [Sedimentisphaerales bacterium]|nr:hypothetical protein [Sedimentisphaerales bacterium]
MRKMGTIFTILCFLMAVSPSVTAALTDGLVGYWPLEGDYTDVSGSGHDGVLVGTATPTTGILGDGLLFSGDWGNAVDCGTWDPSETTGQLSVSIWVNWTGHRTDTWQGIIGKRDAWQSSGEQIEYCWFIEAAETDDSVALQSTASWVSLGGPLPEGQWHHIAISFDGTTVTTYRNGAEISSGGFILGPKKDAHIWLAATNTGPANNFNGAIDEAAIWDRALTAQEITQLYNEGKGLYLGGKRWKAGNPFPADGTTGIAVDQDLLLSWNQPTEPSPKPIAEYDVYFSENEMIVADTNSVAAYLGTLPAMDPLQWLINSSALARDKTYYWRIDAVIDRVDPLEDPNIAFGDVWSFETKKSIPVFLTHPVNAIVNEGQDAVFAVSVESPSEYTVEWFEVGDDATVVGAGETLTIASVTVADDFARQFYAVATNLAGKSLPSQSAGIFIPTMVAHYTCDDTITETEKTVLDSGPVGDFNGTAMNDTSSTDGIDGNALLFDGAGDFVDLGTWNPSEGTGQLTLSLWARWNGLSGSYQGLIGKRDTWGPSSMMWHIELNVDTGVLSFARDGSYPDSGGRVLPEGEWTHVAVIFDGTTATTFINGVAAGFGPFSFGSKTDARIVFGAVEGGGGNPFNGSIDDVRIYNYALAPLDIGMLYYDITGETVCPMYHAYDYNQNCYVDLGDLAMFLSQWMMCNSVPDCL